MIKRFDLFITVISSAPRTLAELGARPEQRKSIIGQLIILMVIMAPLSLAQTYRIDWYVIGSGGGPCQSADYQVDGTIGQPIVGKAASTIFQAYAGFWVEPVTGGEPCEYLIGDINGDNQRLGGDITYGVRYFKGTGTPPRDSCYMDSTQTYLYVAGDCNGDCRFLGSDITRLVQYFKGNASLAYCHFFPNDAAALLIGDSRNSIGHSDEIRQKLRHGRHKATKARRK